MYNVSERLTILTFREAIVEYLQARPGSIPGWVNFFLFFSVLHHAMYQKPVIDHCPWPPSQFNKWHAQNKLLSSVLIVWGIPFYISLAEMHSFLPR
jgi:hypothetical protein